MMPTQTTVGRYWKEDSTGRLWLQEYADHVLVSFLDGHFKAQLSGGEFQTPERKLIIAGDQQHGLRLLAEPIIETLQREREEELGTEPDIQ